MLSLNKIICTTDFSEASYEGVKVANELAFHFSAELILVNMVPTVPTAVIPSSAIGPALPAFNVASYQEDLMASSKKSLEEVVNERISNDLKVKPIIAHGNTADAIVRITDEENADLIVIATHGETGWRHLVFGSVAEKVVRFARCAVLTVQAPRQPD